jgi:hypothetical protein
MMLALTLGKIMSLSMEAIHHPKIRMKAAFNFIILFSLNFFVLCFSLIAQNFPAKNYPKGYFAYPVGATVALSANYGELRPNHYHMGLDCKTDQRENMPIYAAAEGYIAKVKIEPYGFGRALYINHPNGLTTLYAHLNNFYPELEEWVKQQQYKLEQWHVFLDVPANLFPVTKKQFIAYSGNTGGSQGPHLHFEIRDTKTDKVLNPLLFGFPINDNVPPTVTRLALYDRNKSTHEQSPRYLPLKRAGGIYTTGGVVTTNSDLVSFAISATDRYTGSSNPNGIYEAVIYFDGEPLCGFQLDNISYDETRYMNAHIDHRLKLSGGPYVQHLSRLPGYPEGVYTKFNGDGTIALEDDSIHSVRIVVKDTYGNSSVVETKIRRGSVTAGNTEPLWYHQKAFHPGFVNVYETDNVQLVLSERDLYDSIRFNYSRRASSSPLSVSEMHIVHTGAIPVHGYFTIRIKPNKPITAEQAERMVIERRWGSRMDVFKAKKEGPWYSAKFRNFGNFQLLADTEPPTITPIGISQNANLSKARMIRFTVRDNSDEFKNFRAELDGKWLRFTNDKGRTFTYIFDEHCPPGNHVLRVRVEDEAGNETVRVYNFTR